MKRIALGVLALIVAAVAALFIYFNFIREDAPEAFDLTDNSATADENADSADDGGADTADGDEADGDAESTDSESAGGDAGDLNGTWTITTGSQAGYRVVEDLSGIQDFEAVGRTSDVSGSIVIDGATISEGSFEVQVGTITSDDDRRDGQFTGPIMSAAQFPIATLALTEPIDLGSVPSPNTVINTTAVGELTLRDVTNAVTFPVDAQLVDGQIEIVASVDVLFSDYGIANPSNPFVEVRDEGKVEVQLFLVKG